MAYKKEDMIKQCLKAIEENSLVFIEEIIAFVPFSKKTFYNQKLHELHDIKKALEDKRIKIKTTLRKSWAKSDSSSTLQIAAYRLLANEDEFERLVMNQIDHTSKGDKIQSIEFTVASKETIEMTKKLIDESMLN